MVWVRWLVACSVSVSAATAAKEPAAEPAGIGALRECRSIADAALRVACYDRATDALLTASSNKDIVIIDRAEIRKTRRGLFGFALPRIAFLEPKGGKADSDDSKRLETRLIKVRPLGYGKYRFAVEDGAEWETTEASSRLTDLRVGDRVVLEKGLFGAYFLNAGPARVGARRLPPRD